MNNTLPKTFCFHAFSAIPISPFFMSVSQATLIMINAVEYHDHYNAITMIICNNWYIYAIGRFPVVFGSSAVLEGGKIGVAKCYYRPIPKSNKKSNPSGYRPIVLEGKYFPSKTALRARLHCEPPLARLFNLSLSRGKFPKSWKSGSGVPNPKSNKKSNPSGYRPISLLSVVSKLLEKLIHSRISEHLAEYAPISDAQ